MIANYKLIQKPLTIIKAVLRCRTSSKRMCFEVGNRFLSHPSRWPGCYKIMYFIKFPTIERFLPVGNFGCVYKAYLMEVGNCKEETTVAVKTLLSKSFGKYSTIAFDRWGRMFEMFKIPMNNLYILPNVCPRRNSQAMALK